MPPRTQVAAALGKRDGITAKKGLSNETVFGLQLVDLSSRAQIRRCAELASGQSRRKHKNGLAEARYFAASCAHFEIELRKEFAAAGGSISPVSDVRNGTMRP